MLPPLKSGQSVSGQWNAVNVSATGADFTRKENLDSRALAAARARYRGNDDANAEFFYPFKLYSFPSAYRASPDPTTDWLKFRIHGGYCGGMIVAGSDGIDSAPGTSHYVPGGADAQVMPSESGSDFTGTDYVIATGQQVWFWIDSTTPTTPTIKYGYAGMTVSGNGGDPVALGWTAFPAPDSAHIPIGWVDTVTDAATYWAHIRQLLRHDNPVAGSTLCG